MSDEETPKKTARQMLTELEEQEAAERAAGKTAKEEAEAAIELENRRVLRELKAKYGTILRIESEAGMIVVAKPENQEYERCKKAALAPETRPESNRMLNLYAVKYPSIEEFEKLCFKYPALGDSVSGHVTELCGSETKAKKV